MSTYWKLINITNNQIILEKVKPDTNDKNIFKKQKLNDPFNYYYSTNTVVNYFTNNQLKNNVLTLTQHVLTYEYSKIPYIVETANFVFSYLNSPSERILKNKNKLILEGNINCLVKKNDNLKNNKLNTLVVDLKDKKFLDIWYLYVDSILKTENLIKLNDELLKYKNTLLNMYTIPKGITFD